MTSRLIHIHKSEGSMSRVRHGYIYCMPGMIVDLDQFNSTHSGLKSDCIDCARNLIPELSKRNDFQLIGLLRARFKLNRDGSPA